MTDKPPTALDKFKAALKKKIDARKDILDNRFPEIEDTGETEAGRDARIMDDPTAWRRL